MGTNYYAEIDCCPTCKRAKEQIHIGKSSAGWAFLFMPHAERGLKSWQDWKEFLSRANIAVRDEYDDLVPLVELEQLVEAKKLALTQFNASDALYGSYKRDGYMDAEGYRFSEEREFS